MDFKDAVENNLQDHLIVSDFDYDSFKDVQLCLGIDEAGRGPVLGPMVYAALFCPLDKEKQLKEMECAGRVSWISHFNSSQPNHFCFVQIEDSKSLSEKDREKIFEKINSENKFCGYGIKILSPNTISTSMLRKY